MTKNQIGLWKDAADAFDKRHRAVVDADLGRATPCDDFDVEALIRHTIDTQITFGAFLGAATDQGATWEPTRVAMTSALEAPDVLLGEAEHPGLGPTAKTRLLAIATHDMLVHTWDLSRALGLDETLPPGNIEAAIESILAFPEAVREAVFAAPIGVSADADPQTRLLAIAGRQP